MNYTRSEDLAVIPQNKMTLGAAQMARSVTESCSDHRLVIYRSLELSAPAQSVSGVCIISLSAARLSRVNALA